MDHPPQITNAIEVAYQSQQRIMKSLTDDNEQLAAKLAEAKKGELKLREKCHEMSDKLLKLEYLMREMKPVEHRDDALAKRVADLWLEHSKHENLIDTLRQENNKLRIFMDSVVLQPDEQKKEFIKRINFLEDAIKKMLIGEEHYQQKNTFLTEELDRRNKSYNSQCQQLTQISTKHENDRLVADGALRQSQAQLKMSESKQSQLQQQNDGLAQLLTAAKKEMQEKIGELEKRLQEVTQKLVTTEMVLCTYNAAQQKMHEVEELNLELKRCNNQQALTYHANIAEIEKLKKQLEDSLSECYVQDLKKKIDSLTAINTHQAETCTNERASFQVKYDEWKKIQATLNDTLKETTRRNDALTLANECMRGNYESLAENLKQTRAELEKLEKKRADDWPHDYVIAAQKKENERLRGTVQTQLDDLREANATNVELRKERDDLARKVLENSANRITMGHHPDESHFRIKELTDAHALRCQQLKEKDKEIAALKKQLADSDSTVANLIKDTAPITQSNSWGSFVVPAGSSTSLNSSSTPFFKQ